MSADTSNTYCDWAISRAYILAPAQAYVGKFLKTFETYPPRQRGELLGGWADGEQSAIGYRAPGRFVAVPGTH